MYCGQSCKDKARSPEQKSKRRVAHRYLWSSYYQRNKSKVLAKNAAWRESHPGSSAQYMAAYRERNPEKVRQGVREYKIANREKVAERKKQYLSSDHGKRKTAEYIARNRERLNEISRRFQAKIRAANPERSREKQKEWYRRNPHTYLARNHRRRSRIAGAGGRYTQNEWDALLEETGNLCLACNSANVKLTADHIVPVALGGSSNIGNIQPLCQPCNSRKHKKIIDYRRSKCPTLPSGE